MSNSLWPHELQHSRPPCPAPTPRVHPNPCPSSQWCHPNISSSVISFSSCSQSFPASGSFQMSQLFTAGDQSIGVSVSTSVLPMNTQGWSFLVLVLAFINNVHELKNKKKNKTKKQAQFQNKIQVPAKYFPYSTKLQSIYMGFSLFLVLTQLWLSFPLITLPSTNKGFKFPTWVGNDFKFSVSDLISYIYRDEFAKNTTDISWPCIVPTVKREGIDWGKKFLKGT